MSAINAVRVDDDGYVVEFRQFDGPLPAGWVKVNEVVMFGRMRKRLIGGAVIDVEPIVKDNYISRRVSSYPHVADQLDALWHAMDQGLLPKIEPMYSSVLAVKQKHPKPV